MKALSKSLYKYHIFKLIVVSLIISILGVLPYFFGSKGLNLGTPYNDWVFNLTRLQSVASSLSKFQLPGMVSFTSNFANGVANNAMYPWLSSIWFVWILELPIKLIYRFVLFIIVINFVMNLGVVNLVRKFNASNATILMSMLIYQFNQWHSILLFDRFAYGELLGYSLFPWVIYGLVMIWKQDRLGVIVTGLFVGLVANSHLLFIFFVVVLIFITEIVRVLLGKVNVIEIRSLFYAAILSILVSGGTIFNLLYMSLHNKLHGVYLQDSLNPYRVDLLNLWSGVFPTIYNQDAMGWTVGSFLILITIFVWLLCLIRIQKNIISFICLSFAGILTICTTTLVNWNFADIGKKLRFIANIQFTGRLFSITCIFIVIGLALYLEKNQVPSLKALIGVSVLLMTFVSMISMYQTGVANRRNASNIKIDKRETSFNVLNSTTLDYYPKVSNFEESISNLMENNIDKNYSTTHITESTDYIKFKVVNKNNNMTKSINLPVVAYKGINYTVLRNGKNVDYHVNPQFQNIAVHPTNRTSSAVYTIRANDPIEATIIESLSILITVGIVVNIFWRRKESRVDYG